MRRLDLLLKRAEELIRTFNPDHLGGAVVDQLAGHIA